MFLAKFWFHFFSSYKKYLLIQIMLFPNNNKKSINVVNVFPKIHGATVLNDQIMKFHKIYIVKFINFLKIKNIKMWLITHSRTSSCMFKCIFTNKPTPSCLCPIAHAKCPTVHRAIRVYDRLIGTWKRYIIYLFKTLEAPNRKERSSKAMKKIY